MFCGDKLLDEEFHKIVVKDNGIGFKQNMQIRFYFISAILEKDPKYSGTRLGLAICKIVDNHSGYITVESEQ
jgi:light-regulated signal transduction histidine kinase (bacteriophytochrome)